MRSVEQIYSWGIQRRTSASLLRSRNKSRFKWASGWLNRSFLAVKVHGDEDHRVKQSNVFKGNLMPQHAGVSQVDIAHCQRHRQSSLKKRRAFWWASDRSSIHRLLPHSFFFLSSSRLLLGCRHCRTMRHVSFLSCHILSRRRCTWSVAPIITICSRRRGQAWPDCQMKCRCFYLWGFLPVLKTVGIIQRYHPAQYIFILLLPDRNS